MLNVLFPAGVCLLFKEKKKKKRCDPLPPPSQNHVHHLNRTAEKSSPYCCRVGAIHLDTRILKLSSTRHSAFQSWRRPKERSVPLRGGHLAIGPLQAAAEAPSLWLGVTGWDSPPQGYPT